MVDGTTVIFIVITTIIVIGAASGYLFRRTGIPDMIFLVILGLIVGPVTGFIQVEDIASFTPFLSVLTVVVILFDGGLCMRIRGAVTQAPRAIILAVLSFVTSTVVVSFFSRYFMGLTFLESLLFGCIVGGSSSIIVVAVTKRRGLSEGCSTTLIIESTLTDVFCIVGTLLLIEVALTGLPPIEALAQEVVAKFSTGIVIGAMAGLVWLGLLPRLMDEPYRYMVTLASIFVTYFASGFFGGSGAISVLVFGLILGNSDGILALIGRPAIKVVDESFSRLQAEIVFLVKAFFFVYLGIIVSIPEFRLIVVASILSLILLAVRSIDVAVATFGSVLASERKIMTMVYGRGLAAAILAILPSQFGLPNADFYPPIVLLVVVFTALITSIGVAGTKRTEKETIQSRENQS